MKAHLISLIVCAQLIAGCSHPQSSADPIVEYVKPLSPRSASVVTNALDKSPTFKDLRHRATRPMVMVDEEVDGWIMMDIGSLSEHFFHRWATLKVEVATGRVFKLGTDEKFEDKWTAE